MDAAVIGAGSFGTALARVLATNGHTVRMWCRSPDVASAIRTKRENAKYLPGVTLPDGIEPVIDHHMALDGAELVLHAVPSHATREVAEAYADHVEEGAIIVSATKGLEYGSFKRMSEVIAEVTGHEVAALSGPNHAEEVGLDLPAGTVVAHPRYPVARQVAEAFTTDHFRAIPHPDVAGIEVCGAYKNVVALAAGVAAGLDYGDNALASLITVGLHEMGHVLPLLGGERRTAHGLAGLGDLVATCGSAHSRNRTFGEALGSGLTVDEAAENLQGKVAEGVHATRAFHALAKDHNLRLGLTTAVHGILEGEIRPEESLRTLLRNL